jgi:hypothetical protein
MRRFAPVNCSCNDVLLFVASKYRLKHFKRLSIRKILMLKIFLHEVYI